MGEAKEGISLLKKGGQKWMSKSPALGPSIRCRNLYKGDGTLLCEPADSLSSKRIMQLVKITKLFKISEN